MCTFGVITKHVTVVKFYEGISEEFFVRNFNIVDIG